MDGEVKGTVSRDFLPLFGSKHSTNSMNTEQAKPFRELFRFREDIFFNNLSFSVNPTNIFLRDHAILTLTICHSAFLNRVGKVLFCWMLARVPTRDIIKLVSQKYCNFVCWRKLKFCSLTNVCEKYDLFSRKCKTNPFRGNPTAPNHNVPFRPGRELIFLIQCVISTTIQRTVGSPYGSTHTHQRESRKQGAGSGEEKQGAGSGEEKQRAGCG